MDSQFGKRPQASLEAAQTLDATPQPASLLGDTLDAAAAPRGGLPAEAVVTIAGGDSQAIPARIGRYVVLRRLGQGGMGVVYSAYDADLDRKVAIKVVRDAWQASSRGRTRVLHEAQAMARLAHPNVVHVYEVGQDADSPNRPVFIAMEFIAGCSLKDWQGQRRASMSLEELVHMYLQAATGLAAAHDSGLIHRDFKPDNVLVGQDGRARVVDFGLARALDVPHEESGPAEESPLRSRSGARLTEAGAILGTPGYMAPEQVQGIEVDARSDQFSFCVALYEALYQQLPFAGETFEEYSCNVLAGQLRQPPPYRPGALEVPILIDEALRRGLSRQPEARFPSMNALVEAILRGLGSDSDSQRSRRHKQWALLACCSGILIVVSLRIAMLANLTQPDLRHSAALGWFTCIPALLFALVLRRQLRRQPTLRRGVYFFGLLALYMAVGRTVGVILGTPAAQFHTSELVSLAGLCAAEIPHVGLPYVWPTALAMLGAAAQLLFPAYSMLLTLPFYLLLSFLVAYLRPWSTPTSSKGSSATS